MTFLRSIGSKPQRPITTKRPVGFDLEDYLAKVKQAQAQWDRHYARFPQ